MTGKRILMPVNEMPVNERETPATADPTALLTPQGQEILSRLAQEAQQDPLALGARLRRDYPAGLVATAMAQHDLRVRARAKFSRADSMLFTRAGYEQSSSE